MVLLGLASIWWTPRSVREKNEFNYHPIVEVAALFIGIFLSMIPAIQILNAEGPALGLSKPWQFFWATGSLSAFLDNAPTYLTFGAVAAGAAGVEVADPGYLATFLETTAGPAILAAISCGAVFMGAMTYIGNGPNFMVKAIAESSGVRMPSFFGYLGWSCMVLLPLFALVTWLFFL
jgi:Na+/H+ antiporter NhaD/arsenite permease-like protein